MKQAVVTIKYEEEKLNAIKQYMGKKDASTAGEMFRQPSRKAIKILREALEHLPECLRRMSKSRGVAVGKQGEGKANLPL